MAIGLGGGQDPRIKSGTVAPEGVVTADAGTQYQRLGDQAMSWLKRDSSGTPNGWTGLMGKPYQPYTVYVDATLGHDTRYDGQSWGTPFRTIQKAVDTAQTYNGGTVYVAKGTYTETVTISGGIRLVGGGGEGFSAGTHIEAPSNSANCTNINGQCVIQNITTWSTATTWTGIGWSFNNASLAHLIDCRHTGRDTLTPSATNGGTGFKITNSEGMLWERIGIYRASIGFDLGGEASVNHFKAIRGAINWVDLKQSAGGGGNTFYGWKTTGSGDPVTPSTVVDINDGGDNTYIHCDWSEAGANYVDVTSSNNRFDHQFIAPATTLRVIGNHNHFTNLTITGAPTVVSGNDNIFDTPTLKGGGNQLTVNGGGNIVENESGTLATGTGIKRREGPQVNIAPQYVAARTWHTDFSNAEYDAALFTLTNLSYVTDGATPALQLTNYLNAGTIFVTGQPMRNVDIRARYKLKANGGIDISNTQVWPYVRYLGPNNHWRGQKIFNPGNPILAADSNYKGADQGSSTVTDSDVTNTTTYRYLRFQVIEDMVRMKSWFVGSAEPDWQITQRLRATYAQGAVDNVDLGLAGLGMRYSDSYLTELSVTELQRADDNLLWNSEFGAIDTATGYPCFWYKPATLSTGNTQSVVTTTDRDNISRSVLQCVQTAANPAGSVVWRQDLYNSLGLGATASHTRARPTPTARIPRVVEISLWSKGTSITNSGGSLAAIANMYYYDREGNLLNAGGGLGDYFQTLGPNVGGIGTWNWYRTRWRLPFVNPERLTELYVQLGFHDGTARGTLLIADPVIRAVN